MVKTCEIFLYLRRDVLLENVGNEKFPGLENLGFVRTLFNDLLLQVG